MVIAQSWRALSKEFPPPASLLESRLTQGTRRVLGRGDPLQAPHDALELGELARRHVGWGFALPQGQPLD